MKTLLNYSDHGFDFPQGTGRENMVKIPRATGQGSDRKPGRINVDDDQLVTMRNHPVMKGWFGGESLIVADEVDGSAPKAPRTPKAARETKEPVVKETKAKPSGDDMKTGADGKPPQ